MIDSSKVKSRIVQPAIDATWMKAVIYGESGVGKTTLAASKKRGGKTLVADTEHGTISIAGTGTDVIHAQPDYETSKPEDQVYEQLRELYVYLKKGGHPYDTLVVDSLTQAIKFTLTDTIREKVRQKEAKSLYKASQEDYGIMTEKMRYLLWDLHALPMHVIYTCLSQRSDIDGRVGLALTPKFADSVFSYCHVVGYLTIIPAKNAAGEEIKVRKLALQSDGTFIAKIRLPKNRKAPEFILQPTLDKLIALYRGEEEKAA